VGATIPYLRHLGGAARTICSFQEKLHCHQVNILKQLREYWWICIWTRPPTWREAGLYQCTCDTGPTNSVRCLRDNDGESDILGGRLTASHMLLHTACGCIIGVGGPRPLTCKNWENNFSFCEVYVSKTYWPTPTKSRVNKFIRKGSCSITLPLEWRNPGP
jgi:hypothetical protein